MDLKQYESNTQQLLCGKPFSSLWYTSLKKMLSEAKLQGINYFCIDGSGKCALISNAEHAVTYSERCLGKDALIYDLKSWKATSVTKDLRTRYN